MQTILVKNRLQAMENELVSLNKWIFENPNLKSLVTATGLEPRTT